MYPAKLAASDGYGLVDQSMAAEFNQQLQLEDKIHLILKEKSSPYSYNPKSIWTNRFPIWSTDSPRSPLNRGVAGGVEFIAIMEAMGITTDMASRYL